MSTERHNALKQAMLAEYKVEPTVAELEEFSQWVDAQIITYGIQYTPKEWAYIWMP